MSEIIVARVRSLVALVSSISCVVGQTILRLGLSWLLRVALLLVLMMAVARVVVTVSTLATVRHFHAVFHVMGSCDGSLRLV